MVANGAHAFSFQSATEKLSREHTCITVREEERKVSIPPRYIGKENDFFKQFLAAQMGVYSRRLCCVPVEYRKIKRLGTTGLICNEDPNIYLTILVEYIVFQPEVGSELEAVVNKTSASHVGMLVHNHFNASIAKDDEMLSVGNPSVGDEVLIKVTNMNVVNKVLSLETQLVKILKKCEQPMATIATGKHKVLDSDEEQDTKSKLKKDITVSELSSMSDVFTSPAKKRKKALNSSTTIIEPDTVLRQEETSEKKSSRKKKKKDKTPGIKEELVSDDYEQTEESVKLLNGHDEEIEGSNKKKKRKRKHQSLDDTINRSVLDSTTGSLNHSTTDQSPTKKKRRIKTEPVDLLNNTIDSSQIQADVSNNDNTTTVKLEVNGLSPKKGKKKKRRSKEQEAIVA